jgi:hypothetical protein
MKKQNSRKVEGEGSYTAARSYDANVRAFAAKGNVERAARGARQAVEGGQAAELRRAERIGKAGNPKRARSPKPGQR